MSNQEPTWDDLCKQIPAEQLRELIESPLVATSDCNANVDQMVETLPEALIEYHDESEYHDGDPALYNYDDEFHTDDSDGFQDGYRDVDQMISRIPEHQLRDR